MSLRASFQVRFEKIQAKTLVDLVLLMCSHLGLITVSRSIKKKKTKQKITTASWVKFSFLGPGSQDYYQEKGEKAQNEQEQ